MEKPAKLLARLAVIATTASVLQLTAPTIASATVSDRALDKAHGAVQAVGAADANAASPQWGECWGETWSQVWHEIPGGPGQCDSGSALHTMLD
ncbi:hypothetical protein [Streptomyces sp. NPDC050504]|uniref:hypothetical protein n=1 Tax=Streptomyces sp. NPDC050504 TaxID=3365618 RepID=UPI0037B53DC1